MALKILDQLDSDDLSKYRGGGRFITLLKENLQEKVIFIQELSMVGQNDTLLIPFWNPFQAPLLKSKIAKKQALVIFDVIPLKYSKQFPKGIKGTLRLWENKKLLSNFDAIITISHQSKNDIVKLLNINPEKIHVVYLTLPQVFYTKQKSLEYSVVKNIPKTFCLYVGDVNWNKNLANIAKAIKIADIPCVFVGKEFIEASRSEKLSLSLDHPENREYHSFMSEVGNDHRFIFPGYISNEELMHLYQKALCTILISRDEGFGLSYLEASNEKCPSILSDIPVFREIAGDAAIFIDPEDPEQLAQQIVSLRDNMRKEIGEKAYENSKKYNPEMFKKTLLSLLENL